MTDDVLTYVEGALGRIRLNRPKALHALNTTMCEGVLAALDAWEGDDAVETILIDHAEGRGFCAGGDIRMLAESGAGDGVEARRFFATEYRMNHRLFTYPKPIVAFMDGITMGGGVGISQPARFRIATENTRFAMPETGIGLLPDVGGGWYLSRLPGQTGKYLALTGHRLDGAECVALGLATHYVPSARVEAVKANIDTLDDHAETPPAAAILAHRDAIDLLFASGDLTGIFAALESDDGDWAAATLATLRAKSPQSMMVSLRLLAAGARMATFADEMRQEYAVAARVVTSADFIEGVRAVIVDKDNAPRWQPAPSDADIDAIFAPLPPEEAWTPL